MLHRPPMLKLALNERWAAHLPIPPQLSRMLKKGDSLNLLETRGKVGAKSAEPIFYLSNFAAAVGGRPV